MHDAGLQLRVHGVDVGQGIAAAQPAKLAAGPGLDATELVLAKLRRLQSAVAALSVVEVGDAMDPLLQWRASSIANLPWPAVQGGGKGAAVASKCSGTAGQQRTEK